MLNGKDSFDILLSNEYERLSSVLDMAFKSYMRQMT